MPSRSKADYFNMRHSQLQNHYRTQKTIARSKARTLNPFHIFLTINTWNWLYHYLKSRVGKKHPFLDYSCSDSDGVFQMVSTSASENSVIKIVLAADWATDTEESVEVAHLMKKENSDYSIHLGDIYFVGAPQEVYANFIAPGSPWPKGSSGSLAVPGNHEFYSNGNPYFDRLLKHLFARRPAAGDSLANTDGGYYRQDASFFCLENPYWRVIALDNGYYSVGRLLLEYIFKPNAHLDDKLISWLENTIKPAPDDHRGIVILSHVQYCSAFEPQYPKAAEVLKKVLGDREVIWIWGHEHRFAVYGKYNSPKGITAYGRCIGHGGMPVEIGKVSGGREIYKLSDTAKMKQCPLVCYDNRKKEIIGKTILGYNGYAVMQFDHNRLTIEYKDTSTWIFREEWTVDAMGGLHSKPQFNDNVPLSRG